jgi:hypothetical protein
LRIISIAFLCSGAAAVVPALVRAGTAAEAPGGVAEVVLRTKGFAAAAGHCCGAGGVTRYVVWRLIAIGKIAGLSAGVGTEPGPGEQGE